MQCDATSIDAACALKTSEHEGLDVAMLRAAILKRGKSGYECVDGRDRLTSNRTNDGEEEVIRRDGTPAGGHLHEASRPSGLLLVSSGPHWHDWAV